VAGLYTGGGTSGMKIDANGSVGIGNAAPTSQLMIQNDQYLIVLTILMVPLIPKM